MAKQAAMENKVKATQYRSYMGRRREVWKTATEYQRTPVEN